jgi:predicted esterase
MCRFAIAIVAALVAAGLRAQNAEKVAVVEPSAKAPRAERLEWKSAQGRPYWYRLPKEIDVKSPPDLLLMLHGTGLDHRWSFWNYDIGVTFRRRDIVLSPDALTPGQGATFNFVQGKADGEQIADLIHDFKQRFPIGRVYLYGHSQGAFFCYWFAGEYPELIDGIVAHAGNVLDVKHGKLAKQKIAIGILHARADAVVPVECATRTEKIYRDEGYEKVKLSIVEGRTAESGHWPLPAEVAAMLDWCDQVSTQSATQALQTAISELRRPQPDLGVVGEQVAKARKLLPKAGEADKKALPASLDAIGAFLDRAVAAQCAALLADPAVLEAKLPNGPWVDSFLLGERAFASHAEWKRAMAKVREAAARHERAVDKAQKGMEKPTKDARLAAVKAYEDSWLSLRTEALRGLVQPQLAAAGANEADAAQRLAALAKTRAEAAIAAKQAMVARLAPLLAQLQKAMPELTAPAETDGGK